MVESSNSDREWQMKLNRFPELTAALAAILITAPALAEGTYVDPYTMHNRAAGKAVARDGDVMPQKSTYFHPKVLTGLAFHGLDAD